MKWQGPVVNNETRSMTFVMVRFHDPEGGNRRQQQGLRRRDDKNGGNENRKESGDDNNKGRGDDDDKGRGDDDDKGRGDDVTVGQIRRVRQPRGWVGGRTQQRRWGKRR